MLSGWVFGCIIHIPPFIWQADFLYIHDALADAIRLSPVVNLCSPTCCKYCIAGMKSACSFLKCFLNVVFGCFRLIVYLAFLHWYSRVILVRSDLIFLPSLSGTGTNVTLDSWKEFGSLSSFLMLWGKICMYVHCQKNSKAENAHSSK